MPFVFTDIESLTDRWVLYKQYSNENHSLALESKMLHNFQVNFSNMIGKAIFKYPNQVYWNVSSADDLKIANKNQSARS